MAFALIFSAMLFTVSASAEETGEIPVEDAEGAVTVLSLADGSTEVMDDVPAIGDLDETDAFDAVDGYEVLVDDESVLSVDIKSGAGAALSYVSVSFSLSDSKEVFLSGLTAENAEEVQTKIIESYTGGENFELEDLDFIDTEKTRDEDDDDELCWAGAASNMLEYTGWGNLAGFDDEDEIFEAFIDAFTNCGGNTYYALEWFFNGSYYPQGMSGFSQVKDLGNSGGFLTDYCYDMFTDSVTVNLDLEKVAAVFEKLRSDYAVELGIDVYYRNTGSYSNGHATTLWGYVVNTDYDESEAGYYDTVIIADSDSHELSDADRRDAENIYTAYTVSENNGSLTFSDSNYIFLIADFVTLQSYSEDAASETDENATRSRADTADLIFKDTFFGGANDAEGISTAFDEGESLTFSSDIQNAGSAVFSDDIYVYVTVTDGSNTLYSDNEHILSSWYSGLSAGYYFSAQYFTFDIGTLDNGTYTLTAEINPNRTAAEAYYVNNMIEVTFTVGDAEEDPSLGENQYYLGDANGDGVIDISDATVIQRVLAKYISDTTGRISLRGDISQNGLEITDATLLQRYLASFTVDFNIGKICDYPEETD